MEKLYVVGGKERKLGLKGPNEDDEWRLYDSALIVEVETESGTGRTCVEYRSPEDVRSGGIRAAHFHSGAVVGNCLYTCTTTEVLIYRLPTFEQIGYVSLPCFNDLHHVTPSSDGNLLVVSTGLDMVVKTNLRGEIIEEWSVVDKSPWERFSRDIDYRKVKSTKPHISHPNFVFELDDKLWVTRHIQRDVMCLNSDEKLIKLNTEKLHDGVVFGDQILFTAVDGKVAIVNRKTLDVDEIIDLRRIQDHDHEVLPAWCRGVLPVDRARVWIGFTRIRQTVFHENIRWIKTVLRDGTVVKPTHIALFDLEKQQCLQEIDLEPFGMNSVFSIFPVASVCADADGAAA